MKHYCIFCDDAIHKGDGGACTVPFVISNRPTVTVYVHTRCLKPYLSALEANKPTMPERIICDDSGKPAEQWDGRVRYATT